MRRTPSGRPLLANQRLDAASIKAAQAGEAYSAARWELDQARARVREADKRSAAAQRKLGAHEDAYFALLADTYERSPGLTSLKAMVGEDGIEGVLENSNTVYNMNSSMGDITATYKAAKTVADLASGQAEDAREVAGRLEKGAAAARKAADREAQAAMAESEAVAKRKQELLAELAELQDISVDLATRRQSALEAAAQRRRTAAAEAEQRRAAAQTRNEAPTGSSGDNDQSEDTGSTPTPRPDPEPAPEPKPDPKPEPKPDPTPPPSSGGASAAISFARSQIGDPYVWAAAGPDAWDCSGLTMVAWQKGGKSLPHYSAGQYAASTPISSSSLQPGDLVFWGSSSSPSSIYHVALYAGNGRILHAPRTGRPVTEDSMYYWIPPNFFARP